MPDSPPAERQVETKRWTCSICRNHAAEYPRLGLRGCTGKPLTHYTIGRDKIPVCANGARFHLYDQGMRHDKRLQELVELPGIIGAIQKRLSLAINQFRRDRIANLSGDLNPHEYEDFLADSLADWRFIVCEPFLQGAHGALEEMGTAIPQERANEIISMLEIAQSDLEAAPLDPKELSRRDRMSRWSAAKRAFFFLVGNPNDDTPSLQERIRKAAGLDEAAFRREFVVRQFMAAFKVGREEAEQLANEQLMGALAGILQERVEKTAAEEASSEAGVKKPEGEPPAVKEEVPAPTLAERLAALSQRERIVGDTRRSQSRDKAARFFEEHGGLSEGWGAWSRPGKKKTRTVKLAGPDADPEAAAVAMNGAVSGGRGED